MGGQLAQLSMGNRGGQVTPVAGDAHLYILARLNMYVCIRDVSMYPLEFELDFELGIELEFEVEF